MGIYIWSCHLSINIVVFTNWNLVFSNNFGDDIVCKMKAGTMVKTSVIDFSESKRIDNLLTKISYSVEHEKMDGAKEYENHQSQ